MAKKNMILPKNFKEIVSSNDMAAFKKVFDKCDVDAVTKGFYATSALGSNSINMEQMRWLISQGADLELKDSYGNTPLKSHCAKWDGQKQTRLLVESGANINATNREGVSVLAVAADCIRYDNVVYLLENGADPLHKNDRGQTPLEYALSHASNTKIAGLVGVSKAFFDRGVKITKEMKESITRIGKSFEFHREAFNPESVDEYSNALDELYKMYGVEPVARRIVHDGISNIIVERNEPMEQFKKLWGYLVPSSGKAKTVQGEVIRIAGRIEDEINRNGGYNWDGQYKKMLKAFIQHISSYNSLPDNLVNEANEISLILNNKEYTERVERYCIMAVKWVELNPKPIILEKVNYKR